MISTHTLANPIFRDHCVIAKRDIVIKGAEKIIYAGNESKRRADFQIGSVWAHSLGLLSLHLQFYSKLRKRTGSGSCV